MKKTIETEKVIKYYDLVLESAKNGGDIEGGKEIELEIKNLSTNIKK